MIDPGSPWPKFRAVELAIPVEVGGGELTALALADLDGDHLLDLLAAWWVGEEGVVAVGLGGDRGWRRTHASPLTPFRVVARTDARVIVLAAADMDWDGATDVLMALDGRSEIAWFPADLDEPSEHFEITPLPGTVTALATLDYGRRDGLVSPVIGVATSVGPRLALFPEQAAAPEQHPLLVPVAGQVRRIESGNLDGDAWWDLVVATDEGVATIAGRDSASPAEARALEASSGLTADAPVGGIATDRWQRTGTHQIAVLGDDGVRLADPATSRLSRPLAGVGGRDGLQWLRSVWTGVGRGPALAVPDDAGVRLVGGIVTHDDGRCSFAETGLVELGGRPVILEIGRIGRGAVDDMVALVEGTNRPLLLLDRPRATYTVTTLDDHDDGSCDSDCTLREAITAANATPGSDQISLASGIPLPLEFGLTGQLPDLTDTVAINTGAFSWWTIDGSSCTGGCNGLVVAADVCAIEKIHVVNFSKTVAGQRGIGFLLFNSYHSWFDDVTSTSNESHGVYFYNSSDTSLNGQFDNNTEDGVHLTPGLGGLTDNNHIPTVVAIGNGGSGIMVDNVPDTMIGGPGSSDSATIDGNGFAGVNINGSAATGTSMAKVQPSVNSYGNGFHGIYLSSAGASTIGSPLAGAESRLGHNGGTGVTIWSSSASQQITNFGFWDNEQCGIALYGSSNVAIGPDVFVHGNSAHGILVDDDGASLSHDITIADSFVGVHQLAGPGDGNGYFGVEIAGGHHIAVGTAGHGNTIVDNGWGGIRISGADSTFNTIEGNLVGLDDAGTSGHGNQGPGVLVVDSPFNAIGGLAGPNVIAFNEGDGVAITDDPAVQVSCRGNAIYSNGGIGIDLGTDGVTPPDPGDVDEGPNHLRNQPLLAWTESCGGDTYVVGVRDTIPGIFAIDLYGNQACDPTGWGEGHSHLGFEVEVDDATERVRFDAVLPSDLTGFAITSATTDLGGSTSEFSNCMVVIDGRLGDATADCVFAADDVAAIVNVVDDPTYVTVGNPDADGDGVVEADDLEVVVARALF